VTTKEQVNLGLYVAIMLVSQIILSVFINVQLVYFFFLLHLHKKGLTKTLLLSVLFAIMMGVLYGFSWYILGYLYIYPTLIILSDLLTKKLRHPLYLAFIGLVCGFLFGALFSIQDSYFYQIPYMVYWIRGIPYDAVHGLSNFFALWILYPIFIQLKMD
jgi:hypothetical protein